MKNAPVDKLIFWPALLCVSAVIVLLGMFQRAWVESSAAWQAQMMAIAVLAVSGVVLGAWYMLYLVQRVFFGPLRLPQDDPARPLAGDLSLREILAVAPLVAPLIAAP